MGSSKRTCKHVKKIHSSNRPNFGLRIDGLIRLALALDNDTAQPLRLDATFELSAQCSVDGWARGVGAEPGGGR